MIVLPSPGQNTYNNNGSVVVDHSAWTPQRFSASSAAYRPNTTKSLLHGYAKAASTSWSSRSNPSLCGLCRRLNCQLRSHRAYLSAQQPRSETSFHDLGTRYIHPGSAKPKPVDDRLIRAAFTKSYAFCEPSYLSVLQPSSFRLDVFHDLPILGGDRPEMHASIRDFLSHHFRMLSSEYLSEIQDANVLKQACLAVALTNHTVCLCMLATEKAVREQTPQAKRGACGLVRMQCCRTGCGRGHAQQQLIDPVTYRIVSESIIAMCTRLVLDLQVREQAMSAIPPTTALSTERIATGSD